MDTSTRSTGARDGISQLRFRCGASKRHALGDLQTDFERHSGIYILELPVKHGKVRGLVSSISFSLVGTS